MPFGGTFPCTLGKIPEKSRENTSLRHSQMPYLCGVKKKNGRQVHTSETNNNTYLLTSKTNNYEEDFTQHDDAHEHSRHTDNQRSNNGERTPTQESASHAHRQGTVRQQGCCTTQWIQCARRQTWSPSTTTSSTTSCTSSSTGTTPSANPSTSSTTSCTPLPSHHQWSRHRHHRWHYPRYPHCCSSKIKTRSISDMNPESI